MIPLLKRSLTGVVFVAVVIIAIYAGGFYMAALLWLVMNLGLCEWRELCCKMQCGMPSFWLFLLGNMAYLAIVLVQYAQTSTIIQGAFVPLLGWGTVLVSAIMIISSIFRKEDGPWNKIWLRMGMVLAGVLYISVSLALLNFLAGSSLADGPHVLMGFFVLIWTGDVFAYLTGSLFGHHKLCERLSPSKTWEGAAGGFVFALLAAFLWGKYVLFDMPLGIWMCMSGLIVLCGMLGDLVESKIKREAGVKDSGKILPGHGGILDRFDSVLIAAPVAVACWQIMAVLFG